MKKLSFLSFLVVLLFFSFSLAFADEELTFPAWLKKHEAWDSYEKVLQQEKNTPKVVLERAYSLLRLGEAKAALQLLEEHEPFTDQLEAERLWLYGSALRLNGDGSRAVLTLSKALKFYEPKKQKELLLSQQALSVLWEAVWRQWLWECLASPLLEKGRRTLLLQVAQQGELAWPKKTFWQQAKKLAQGKNFVDVKGGYLEPALNQDRLSAARALLASAAGFKELAMSELKKIQKKDLCQFWGLFLSLTDEAPFSVPQNFSSTATDFFEAYGQGLAGLKKHGWNLTMPEIPSWKKFYAELATMSPEAALTRLKKELESSLIPEDLRGILENYVFIFQLIAADFAKSGQRSALKTFWNKLAKDNLSPAMQISALLVFTENQDFTAQPLYPAFCTLAAATGYVPHAKIQSSFWKKAPSVFDPLAQYQELKSQFFQAKKKKTAQKKEVALHLAYLFPESVVAQQALFFLAQQAHAENKPVLAWRYLQRIVLPALPKEMEIDYFLAKAGLEMQLGKEKEALSSYLDILAQNPQALPPVKKLRLALLAQQQNQWPVADKILHELWAQKKDLSKELQAELLFWIGEGQQYMGQTDEALETYLRLGWKYPKENMWAVTALYRAGLIYEQQGKSAAAKKLYQTVLENSGRESQKKAAKQRIKAIESKGQENSQPLF